MLGMASQYQTIYLKIFMISTTLFFALPIVLAPLHWAKLMQWQIPEDTHLALYFGRCLGVFILIVEWLMWRASFFAEAATTTFQVLFGVFGGMLLLHIYGAIKKIQPITETLEIGFWLLLLIINTLCYPISTSL